MSIPVRIEGSSHSDHNAVLEQSMHKKEMLRGKGFLPGSVVYTEPFKNFVSEGFFFINDTFGIDMNQNVTFSGTPEIIHDGGTTSAWTASIISGTWNFADAGKTTITAGNNNDAAFFDQGASSTNTDNYTALSGKIDLDTYNPLTNDLKYSLI